MAFWCRLQVVSQLLPLPHLRCGFLLAADPERRAGVDETWATCWFVLDHASLRTAPLQEQQGGPGVLLRLSALTSTHIVYPCFIPNSDLVIDRSWWIHGQAVVQLGLRS